MHLFIYRESARAVGVCVQDLSALSARDARLAFRSPSYQFVVCGTIPYILFSISSKLDGAGKHEDNMLQFSTFISEYEEHHEREVKSFSKAVPRSRLAPVDPQRRPHTFITHGRCVNIYFNLTVTQRKRDRTQVVTFILKLRTPHANLMTIACTNPRCHFYPTPSNKYPWLLPFVSGDCRVM